MKSLCLPIIVLAVALSTGCASLSQLQAIPVTVSNSGEEVKESGALFLWPPYSSAAVVDGKGNRCVLAASGAKTIDASSQAVLKLGKALEKIEGLDATVKNELTESFTKLSSADSRAAFTDIALFHLCIFDQNGTFKYKKPSGDLTEKSKAMMDAFYKVMETAKELP